MRKSTGIRSACHVTTSTIVCEAANATSSTSAESANRPSSPAGTATNKSGTTHTLASTPLQVTRWNCAAIGNASPTWTTSETRHNAASQVSARSGPHTRNPRTGFRRPLIDCNGLSTIRRDTRRCATSGST